MLTLMTARLVGSVFNDDLYHIHIHKKKGVHFLEAEFSSLSRYNELLAGQIMGDNVIFFRPVEKVGTIVDVLKSCTHSTFPVVDTEGDENNLFGTISRNEVCALLKSRSFGRPVSKTSSHHSDYIHVNGEKFLPITGWDVVEGSYPKYPKVTDIRIGPRERDLLVDLRPYANTAPVSVQETATVNRTYNVFRTLGLRFLPVVNKRKQIVGTITRSDICPEGLSSKMLKRGAKKQA